MKRMKNALGAALSILLTLSMVLGSTAVAVAEEGTNQATSYASQFDAAYNTMLNDAKSLEFKAYTGTDAQYGAEDIKGSQGLLISTGLMFWKCSSIMQCRNLMLRALREQTYLQRV